MNSRKHRWFVGLICLGLLLTLALPVSATQAQMAPPQRAPLSEVEAITMPPVDVKALLAEDQAQFEAGLPVLRFAYPFPVQYSPMDVGTWETLNDDSLLWRLRIASPGALSLNLGFTRYQMPSGGQLLLYTPDYREIFGPFTEADNEDHGELWTPILESDEIVVELSLPAGSLPELELELGAINHGYVKFGVPRVPESGMCNVDVVCGAADGYPEIDAWRDEIRSAGAYSIGGTDTCSGALINNTAQDLTPYFLTADHCGITSGNAATVVVYWNYENSWCRPPDTPPSGQDGDGQRNQFNSGSYFRAGYDPSDFTLIELDDPLDPSFNPHWAGWDRRDQATSSAVALHHPGVEEKRISFEDDPTSITDYLSDVPNPNGTHIRVEDWDLGTTEGGSSGSPLFSPEQRIVGDLTGGYAACYNDEPDWYGRVFISWTGGGTPESRLSDWLDPLGIAPEFLDGRDILQTPFGLEVTPPTLEICAPDDATYSITVTQLVTDFVDPVTLAASGEPTGTTVAFSTNPVIPPGTSDLTIGNTAAAPPGSYDIDVVAIAATHTLTVTVGLDLATAIPAQPTLVSPPNGAVNVGATPVFSWTAVAQAASYYLEVATDPGFGNVVYSATTPDTNHVPDTPLEFNTIYYWHVQASNGCGTGSFSDTFYFQTAAVTCETYDSSDVPLPIPEGGGSSGTTESILDIAAGGTIYDVNVLNLIGTHSYMGDLDFFLDSPEGTQVQLMEQACGTDEDFDLNLDDEAPPGPWPCPPTDGDTYQPTGFLGDFDGEDSTGTWTLSIVDNYSGDTGQLDSWSLEICVALEQCITPTVSLVNDSPVELGQPVHFVAALTGTPPFTFTWDFGGPGVGSGLDTPTPVFTYTAVGTYTAMVTVENACGEDADATTVVVNPAPVCTDVASVDLALVTVGTIYTDTLVEFEADVAPDDASKPYSYTVDYDDGTVVAGDSSDDPLALSHTFAATGTYAIEVSVWNCEMEVPATDVVTVTVYEQGVCVDLASITILGETTGEPGTYTFTTSYEPMDATQPISYTWDNGDVEDVSVRSLGVGTHTLLVTATNCAEALVTGTHTIVISGPAPEFYIYLPLVLRDSDS